MKKTVSVNIKGINFLIEEDAYETLHQYLKRLEDHLKNQEGSKDIFEDIELRIAELCQSNLSDKKQVIEIEDINLIIETLGQPEDYLDEENESQNKRTFESQTSSQTESRRLYRDLEYAKIAGICAGISNYLNIDVIVIRIIFLLFLFVGGFGIPLYIILWIVIPQAVSSIDRLRMQGKPITVDSVKEEFEQAAERLNQSTKSFTSKFRNRHSYHKRFTSLGNLITTIVGISLLGFGSILFIVFVVFLFGGANFIPIETLNGYISFNQLGNLLLNTENDIFLSWIGIILTAISVVLFFISNGTYLIMRIRNKWSKIASFTLVIFAIIGISICVYIGSKIGREMVSEAKIERNIGIINAQELIISTNSTKKIGEFEIKEGNNFGELKILKNSIRNSGIEIKFKTSNDSLFHIYQNLSAHSYSYFSAISKAKNIKHQTKIDSNHLIINPFYTYPIKDKIRNQNVKIIVEIPIHKWVKINGEKINLEKHENNELQKFGYINHSGEIETWD